VFKSQRGQLAEGSHRGRASAPSVPIERDRAPPSKPTQALPWTCLRTTQPTLIERGMGVHSNHPLAARRGIRNSRPARWGLRKPHPPSRGETARARKKTSRKALPDRLERAQARGLNARLHLLGLHPPETAPAARASPKPAETLPMPVETCATPSDQFSRLTPAGAPTLLQGFGG
jgi:hypothetical protein